MFAEVVFYVQIIKGKSEVDVIPQGACGDYCSTLQVGLNEGDTRKSFLGSIFKKTS